MVVTCLLLASLAHAASYGTIDMKYLGYNQQGALWQGVRLKVDTNRDGQWNWNHNTVAGQYPFRWDEDDSALTSDEARDAFNHSPTSPIIYGFCVDVAQYAGAHNQYSTFTVADPEGMYIGGSDTTGAAARYLSSESAAYLAEHFSRHWDLVTTRSAAASFAAVAWEIMYEDPFDLTDPSSQYNLGSGYVQVTDAGLGATWLSELDGTDQGDKVFALISDDYQDMSVPMFGYGSSSAPIPEPLTVMGLLLGAGGISRYVLRRVVA